MALAIRMEKGVLCGIIGRWIISCSYFHWGFADIIFSWGQYNDGYFNSHNFSYKYLFQTGQIAADGNYNDENEKKIISELSNDLNFINILDNSCGPVAKILLILWFIFIKKC